MYTFASFSQKGTYMIRADANFMQPTAESQTPEYSDGLDLGGEWSGAFGYAISSLPHCSQEGGQYDYFLPTSLSEPEQLVRGRLLADNSPGPNFTDYYFRSASAITYVDCDGPSNLGSSTSSLGSSNLLRQPHSSLLQDAAIDSGDVVVYITSSQSAPCILGVGYSSSASMDYFCRWSSEERGGSRDATA